MRFPQANRLSSGAGPAWIENALEEHTMIFDYSLAAIVSAGLLFYLTYALLRPERF
jgi:K+-transporting ATPase KdpF subunit